MHVKKKEIEPKNSEMKKQKIWLKTKNKKQKTSEKQNQAQACL